MSVELYCGDCLEIMPTLAGPVDAIITDLPYGTTACGWDTVIPFAPMWAAVKSILKPTGAFVTTASQPFTSLLICSNLDDFRYELIYKKQSQTGHLDANRRPMKHHENIVVFGGETYNPQMSKGDKHQRGNKPVWYRDTGVYSSFESGRVLSFSDEYYPTSIVEVNRDSETTVTTKDRPGKIERHPTQKPVALYEYLIRTYTNPGDTVLDICMGSGTTGVACVQTGRNFIGIEMEPKYYEIAKRRIAAANPPLFTDALPVKVQPSQLELVP